MRVLVVIPARLASTRLPRKVLLAESGRPLIAHVHERARRVPGVDRVVIATDSVEVEEACRGFGAEVMMTRADHRSGTDRVAEVSRRLAGQGDVFDLVVNLQGDEPELDPAHVEQLIALMADGDPMGTLAERITDPADFTRPQVVKVVLGADGRALYFSRAPIPARLEEADAALREAHPPLRHIGLYAYGSAFLERYTTLAPSLLEQIERLEQLRALHHGATIRVGVVEGQGARGIDTREDYDAFLARLRTAGAES